MTAPEVHGAPEAGPRVALAFLAALALVEHAADEGAARGLGLGSWRAVAGLPGFRRFYVCPGGAVACRHAPGSRATCPVERTAAGAPARFAIEDPQEPRRMDAETIVLQALSELYKPSTGE